MSSCHRQRSVCRQVGIAVAVVAALVTGIAVGVTVNPGAAEAQPADRSFASGTGIILNYVKPDSTSDFEAVMTKLGDALWESDNEVRQQQALGWKVYRAREPGAGNSVLYVWVVDPAVAEADYGVATILSEAFPAEVQGLYETFSETYAGGQARLNLDLVTDFSSGGP